ncbi:hypothetical protein K491DRAFT_691058 [Lophiostoma macrostomum CBS 122681]|uniref:Wax synthase domain-containing protein n=1 Tax=Lophiostoma macrostomum CBS 122681 TaxID=1314788 RepID=A0A6A6TC71_9PLEO|nr:hypothetical protein K491DRAFT_691058 [Lophiostoma macrostomum CBS 122681]
MTTSPWPRTHHEVIRHYYDVYDKDLEAGRFQPFLYPWGTFGALVVIVYLLIPHQHRPWLRKARFLAFAWITGFAAYSIKFTRARGMAPAFGLGLISAWSIIWIMSIIVVNDAQTDFQRIERMEGLFGKSLEEQDGPAAILNGLHSNEQHTNGSAKTHVSNDEAHPHEKLGPSKRHGGFAWQPYPMTPFIERLDWVLDIFCNFRGAGWNWRTSTISPPPKPIQEQLHRNSATSPSHSARVHPNQPRAYTTRRSLLIANTKTFIIGYLILDSLKTLINHDPYFWGFIDRKPPSYFPSLLTQNDVLLRIYHLTISLFAIKWALQTIFALAPLFFSGFLGPIAIGARAEPWMYPETWGPFTSILDRGLAGWWSVWWHQTFRFAFEQPSRKVVKLLGMNPRAPLAKFLQLVIAFGLSGTLHACGSYTSAGTTYPLSGSMLFFLLQALGIFTEVVVTQGLRRTGIQERVPQALMRVFTFVYVHVWFYYTAPLLCDEFARGGIWLFEPVPVSILRGLGLGVEGDGWWCWGGKLVWWHTGDRWWRSGLAF